MQTIQKLSSHKKQPAYQSGYQSSNYFLSPAANKNILEQQITQLQLLNQQQLIQRLKQKKQQMIKQSQSINKNCHQYFMNLTTQIINIQNKAKKHIDKETLNFLQHIDMKIEEIKDNQHSYNTNNQIYQIFKTLSKNFVVVEENLHQVSKIIEKCYIITFQGINQHSSYVDNMSTNKIYISESQFVTTNKKTYGNAMEITQKQFELALAKFQQRQQKNMIVNERLKNKIKSLEQALAKKGLTAKQLNRFSATNQKNSPDLWDLELERIRGQNNILTEQINKISNKLIQLTSQNQALKGQYKKMIQSNISHISNNNTIFQQCSGGQINLQQNSRLIMNGIDSQNFITSQIMLPNPKQIRQQNDFSVGPCMETTNIYKNLQNQLLFEYQKKNQNLTVELNKKNKQIQQMRSQINQNQKNYYQLKHQLQQKDQQLDKLSHHCNTLEHDYQISSKKRFQLEEKLSALRQSIKQSSQRQKALGFQHSIQIQNLQNMLKTKQQTLQSIAKQTQQSIKSQYSAQIINLQSSVTQLANQISIKKNLLSQTQAQLQLKQQNFKQQFKRLQKSIMSKQQQITHLRQELFQVKNQIKQQVENKKQENNQTYKQKYQANKKQLTKVKKQFKQKNKDYENLKGENIKMNQLIGIKCAELHGKLEVIVKDIQKCKSIYEGRLKIMEQKIKLMKQRFQFNFTQLSSLPGSNETKKFSVYIQQIQKYIQTMQNFCTKTAEIKRLKQQNKQLKSSTNSKSVNKNIKKQSFLHKDAQNHSNTLQSHSQQLNQLERNLLQDRLRIEKQTLKQKLVILEEEINLIKQKLGSKESAYKELEQQASKLRKQLKKLSSQQQQTKDQISQQNQSNLTNQIKLLQAKLQKQQQQIKSLKNANKKITQQLSTAQNQLKKKKQHVNNIKKDHSSQQEKIDQLNFIIKNKSQQIQKLKRQIKDLMTKDTLINQMKQKMDNYTKLQSQNQQLKKQLQKQSSLHKFQLNKITQQLKSLKTQKFQQASLKITAKTNELTEQISDLRNKNKKLKLELQRKQTFIQHTKTKLQNQLIEMKADLEQNARMLNGKNKECQNYQKKIEIANINSKKFKDRAKLLTVVVKKIYQKVIQLQEFYLTNNGNSDRNNIKSKSEYPNYQNNQNSTLLQNTSPITRVFNSNVFNNNSVSPLLNKQKENVTLSTLAQLDINLQDLQKYSEGLEMFGLNAMELKNMQNTALVNENNHHNQTSFISHYMASPQRKNQTTKSEFIKSPTKEPLKQQYPQINMKQKVQMMAQLLSQKEQIKIQQILQTFDKEFEIFK